MSKTKNSKVTEEIGESKNDTKNAKNSQMFDLTNKQQQFENNGHPIHENDSENDLQQFDSQNELLPKDTAKIHTNEISHKKLSQNNNQIKQSNKNNNSENLKKQDESDIEENSILHNDTFSFNDNNSIHFNNQIEIDTKTSMISKTKNSQELISLKTSFNNFVTQQIYIMIVAPMVAYLTAEVR